MNKSKKDLFHIHLVSDATGETISSVVRACLAQFDNLTVKEHFWSLVRNDRQLEMVFDGIRQWPGFVIFTFADRELRQKMGSFCLENDIPCQSVLEPILNALSAFFGHLPINAPGKQHMLDADYFARIDAMEFALSLDDGNNVEKLSEADVLILGVSRTSKTPTCVYLSAFRGIRAANIPIVPNVPLHVDLSKLTKPLIVGLSKNPESLLRIRQQRQTGLKETSYTNLQAIREEVLFAKRLFSKLKCPVIDVSSQSIEETASQIITLLNQREMQKKNGGETR